MVKVKTTTTFTCIDEYGNVSRILVEESDEGVVTVWTNSMGMQFKGSLKDAVEHLKTMYDKVTQNGYTVSTSVEFDKVIK